MTTVRALSVLLIHAYALGGVGAAQASFTALVGSEVTFCSASVSCHPTQNCDLSVEDLQISLGQCSASCEWSTFPSVYPGCDLFSDVKGYASWEAHGVTWYVTNRDVLFESVIDVFGERVSPQRFVISGSYDLTFVRFLGQLGYDQTGSAEIAVIRFSADPAGLVGLLPTGVDDLVAAGLIEESDILYRDDFTDATNFAMEFSFEVDVTDINDGQLFLFATAQSEVPEPEQWMMLAAGIACLMGLHCRREKMRV